MLLTGFIFLFTASIFLNPRSPGHAGEWKALVILTLTFLSSSAQSPSLAPFLSSQGTSDHPGFAGLENSLFSPEGSSAKMKLGFF